MNNLLRLIGRRLVALPIMVVGVSFLVFFIMSLSPIDPAYSALGETATPEALEEYRVQHGLNDPFFVQYGHYLWNMLHGDLGTYGVGTSNHVTDLVAQALPITLQLTFLGLFFAVIISFPLVFRNMITGSNPAKVEGFQAISSTGLQLLGVSAK